MTIKEGIYEIRELFSDYHLVEPSRLDKDLILHLMNQKRGRIIQEDYSKHHMLGNSLVQNMGPQETTKVDYSDELDSTEDCKCTLAKVTIPPIVEIKSDIQRVHDIGLVQIRSTCGIHYLQTTRKKFITMQKYGDIRSKMPIYFRESFAIYMNPWRKEVNFHLILENPLDGYVVRSENVANGTLIPGQQYEVVSGNISYDTGAGIVVLQRGSTFTASLTPGTLSWTGSGIVKYVNKKRSMTYDDEYPVDANLWYSIKELIKADLHAGKIGTADMIHDGKTEIKA